MRTLRRRSERGAAMVEAAISLLPFFIFVFGIIEAGRFMSVQETLTNAAREGARHAVLPLPGTTALPGSAAVEERVRTFLRTNHIQDAQSTVTITPQTVGTTTFTIVTVTMPYEVITTPWFNALEITLSGSSRMRNETSPS